MPEPVPQPPLRSADEVLNVQRFEELLVYVAAELGDDSLGGDTKINKALCFSDFIAFTDLGHTITGAEYHRQPQGPLARPLLWVRDGLVQSGDLEVYEERVIDYTRRTTRANRPADTSIFEPAELKIVDFVLEKLRGRTADDVSALSHKLLAGWQVLNNGETIPPETLFVDTRPLSDARRKIASQLAKKHGWA